MRSAVLATLALCALGMSLVSDSSLADQCTMPPMENVRVDLPGDLDYDFDWRAHCIMEYEFEDHVKCDHVF